MKHPLSYGFNDLVEAHLLEQRCNVLLIAAEPIKPFRYYDVKLIVPGVF
ncbi:hypothetical protein [Shimia thalassica]|nr:hypothetical protein [Shimia thalassica]MDP2520886.1 hypothetical protein [Shimia thalassica]